MIHHAGGLVKSISLVAARPRGNSAPPAARSVSEAAPPVAGARTPGDFTITEVRDHLSALRDMGVGRPAVLLVVDEVWPSVDDRPLYPEMEKR